MATRVGDRTLGASGERRPPLPPHSVEASNRCWRIDARFRRLDQVADRVVPKTSTAMTIDIFERCGPDRAAINPATKSLFGHLESQVCWIRWGGLRTWAPWPAIHPPPPIFARMRTSSRAIRAAAAHHPATRSSPSALEPEPQGAEIVDMPTGRVQIAERGSRGKVGSARFKSILPDVVNRIDEMYHSDGKLTASPPASQAHEMTRGLNAGDLIIVAGRPSMGKTTLAVNIAENCALGSGKSAAIFSMEMSAESLTLRRSLRWAESIRVTCVPGA